MEEDQQFCLRWNNHQSTIVSVFDNLLENETLIDCSLFAEGKSLKAHKVVLSACSPYFESVLTQTFDKHPIFVLKDVKFQELKAIMEYMYRGEVNISQDQLSALLKVAESLQIKGLSDSRNKENDTRKTAPPPPVKTPPSPAKTPPPAPTLPRVQGLTIEQRKAPKLAANTDVTEESRSRDGSISPVLRKRKKPKRRTSNSQDGLSNDNHDASSSSESHSVVAASTQNIPCSARSSLTSVSLASKSKITDVPDQLQDTKTEITTRQSNVTIPHISVSSDSSISQVPIRENLETHSELILEPKSEYIEEEMNEDSVEDLTLEDDDDVSQMEQDMDHARPGPSHGSTDNSQGFGGWHMSGNQAQDEVFLAAQEAVGAHRDSQVPGFSSITPAFFNEKIIPQYRRKITPVVHKPIRVQKENSGEIKIQRFACNKCERSYKNKRHLYRHMKEECIDVLPKFQCQFCMAYFRRKYHLVRHLTSKHGLSPNTAKNPPNEYKSF